MRDIAMATDEKAPSTTPGVVKTGAKGFKSLQAFITKFNNDWVLSLASGLAFNLMVAIIPIIIAIIALAGFIYGGLNPAIQEELIQQIQNIFPPPIPSQEIVGLVLNSLNKDSGALGIIAIVTAIIGGSGLFVAMEGQFDIIYQIRTRGIIQQYIMALGMLLVFVVLSPFMLFANSLPTVVHSFAQKTLPSQITSNGFGFVLLTIFCGLLATWVLIEIIYLVVPNQHISFRDSWFGALLAAVAVQAYLQLFPFYATHFLSGYTGTVGFAIIFVFFFYFFGVILLGGAEINAFYAQGKRALPDNMAVMVHEITNHTLAPTDEKGLQDTSASSQKHEDLRNIS
jgi:membrane protein